MAWGLQYNHKTRDRHNVLWTTNIYKKGYMGGVIVNGGLMYNWYAAAEINRKIAATGWHVPTAADYITLATNLGGATVAGGKLKETGLTWWDSPNTGATNEVGFNARGNGARNPTTGAFVSKGQSCWIWTSDELTGNGVQRNLRYDSDDFLPSSGGVLSAPKESGATIRLIRDTPSGEHGSTSTYRGTDGKEYPTFVIYDQEWMAADLCETRFTDGTMIPVITDASAWIAATEEACCAYNNDMDNAFTVEFEILNGPLYNGYIASDPRYFAPAGWHIPTAAEVDTLVTTLGGASVAGAALKEVGTDYWLTDPGSTNSSGFTARGAGRRDWDAFRYLKEAFHMVTSTTAGLNYAFMSLAHNTAEVTLGNYSSIFTGGSVRLIKDDETNPGIMTGNDGKTYRTVKIGSQVWTAENSCETQFRNGDFIEEIQNQTAWAAATGAAMCAYNNDWTLAYDYDCETLEGATDKPLQIEYLNESDKRYDPIKSSRAVMAVRSYKMFALAEFYSSDEMANKIEVYQDTDLYWRGYIDPKQYQEEYGPVPYVSKIYCIDGLTLLKNAPYEESPDVPYEGRKTYAQILIDILAKIGFDEFKEFINIYEVSMDSTVDDSPLDQETINTDIFTEKGMYCYDVLKQLLKKFNASIRQIDGIFCLYRTDELTGDTVYGRHFTGPTTKSSVSFTPSQQIWRPFMASTYRQVIPSVISAITPLRKVVLSQDYGNRQSWLRNWELKGETYDGEDFENWTQNNGEYARPINEYLPEEKDGVIITGLDPLPNPIFEFTQTIGSGAIASTTDKIIVEFEYGFFNPTGSYQSYAEITMQIYQDGNNLEIEDENTLVWDSPGDLIRIGQAAEMGFSGWTTFKRSVTGIPSDGDILVRIFPIVSALGVMPVFKNIRIYITSTEIRKLRTSSSMARDPRNRRTSALTNRYAYEVIEVKIEDFIKREYTAHNNINGEEDKDDFMLGDVTDCEIDNILEQFAGALGCTKKLTYKREDTVTFTGTSGSANVTCNGVTELMEWVTDLETTLTNFKFVYGASWAPDVELIAVGETLIFRATTAGEEFTGETSVANVSGDLAGSSETTTEAYAQGATAEWNRRDHNDSLPLLQIIANERAAAASRGKQFVDMTIMEMDVEPTELKMLGNFQDGLNRIGNQIRSFVVNRGTFNVRYRRWKLDMMESVPIEPLTVDTTEITVDSTTVTTDQTHK